MFGLYLVSIRNIKVSWGNLLKFGELCAVNELPEKLSSRLELAKSGTLGINKCARDITG